MAIVLIVAFASKRRVDADADDRSVTREYLEANFVFYYAAVLFLALLWNWFGVQWSDPPTSDTQLWVVIDVTLPLLLISTGFQLLRDSSN